MSVSRARAIAAAKGALRGRGQFRGLLLGQGAVVARTTARERELKARLKRARTATVKPKGRLPNPDLSVTELRRLIKEAEKVLRQFKAAYGSRTEYYQDQISYIKALKEWLASKTRRNPGFFGSEAVAKAKRVTKVRRVMERDTKQPGEIIGVQPGGFLKVKWDNRERPTLIKRSEIKRYPYLRNPGLSDIEKHQLKIARATLRMPQAIADVMGGPSKTEARETVKRLEAKQKKRNPGGDVYLVISATNKADPTADVYYKGTSLRTARETAVKTRGDVRIYQVRGDVEYEIGVYRNGKRRNPGLMELAGSVQALEYLADKAGPGRKRKRSNPKVRRCDCENKKCRVAHALGDCPNRATVLALYGKLCDKCAKYMPKEFLRNPSVREMSTRFQGRASGQAEEFYFSDSAPRLDFSRGGQFVFIKLKGTTIRVANSVVAIDPVTERLWLGTKNANGMFKRKAKRGEGLDHGPVDEICYLTAKKHIGSGKIFEYHHRFGEDGGRKPTLIIDHDGMPILKGGDYKIEARGIVN